MEIFMMQMIFDQGNLHVRNISTHISRAVPAIELQYDKKRIHSVNKGNNEEYRFDR